MKTRMKTKWIVNMTLLLMFLVGCTPTLSSSAVSALLVTETQTTVLEDAQPVQNDTTTNIDEDVLSALQETFQQIYTNVNPSVVNIQVTESVGPMETSGEGSGFVWDTEGHIVTNNHVVENASQITVVFSDGTTVEAELVGTDSESDLSVIQVDATGIDLQPVTLADSQAVRVGDLVIAIGNPYGLSGTMTQGIISALDRYIPVDETDAFSTGSYAIPDIVQTDAAINPGNSGGVLVDVEGQVIGVTSAIASSSDSNSGIGFVIPSHIVERVVPVLIEEGTYQHPRVGISGTTLTSSLAQEMGLEASQQGVLVVSVTEGGPADQAGLVGSSQQRNASGQVSLTGGDVIIAVDGQIVNTFEDLLSYLFNETEVGQTITLTILRQGKEQTIQLTLDVLS
jgi:S1-C subfamily serine protease